MNKGNSNFPQKTLPIKFKFLRLILSLTDVSGTLVVVGILLAPYLILGIINPEIHSILEVAAVGLSFPVWAILTYKICIVFVGRAIKALDGCEGE